MSEVRLSFGFPLSIAVHSDVGRVRTNNEDSFGRAWLPDGSLFVMVADGMGGHEAGEVASGLAVQVVEDVVGRDAQSDPRERLYTALLEANEAILEEGKRSGKQGMGTTSIVALLRGPEAHVGLVGDSRCYHIRNGHLIWRTVDHTRVQMLIDQGEIDEEQARVHPEAGMLTRALGHGRMADGRPLVPDVLAEPLTLQEHDSLVLCSDGLHDLIEDWEIGKLVAGRAGQEAAEALVELACERGGHDNVTVAVVVAGPRAGEFDPSFAPPSADGAESTFTGFEDDGSLDEQTTEGDPMPAMSYATPVPGGASLDGDEPVTPKRSRLVVAVMVLGVLALLAVGTFVVLTGVGVLGYLFGQ
jgi:protein phosphatase